MTRLVRDTQPTGCTPHRMAVRYQRVVAFNNRSEIRQAETLAIPYSHRPFRAVGRARTRWGTNSTRPQTHSGGDSSCFPHQMMSTDTGHHEKVRIHRPESWRRCSHPACSLEAFGTVQIWSYRNHFFFFFCFIVAFHCFVFLEKSHGCNEAQAGINLSANFSCLPNI